MEKEKAISMVNTVMQNSIDVKIAILNDKEILDEIIKVTEKIVSVIRSGGKVLVCGNGGSAGDAQHIAGEFINKFYFDRAPLPCIALTCDTSVITAVGNDYSFNQVFAKQVSALATEKDFFWGISTSGNSQDIVEAIKVCREKNVPVFSLVGANMQSSMSQMSDYVIHVPSKETPRIQEAHILVYHIICQLVEETVFHG